MWSILGDCGSEAMLGNGFRDELVDVGIVGYINALGSFISGCLNLATLLVILPMPVTGLILSLFGDVL